MNRLNTRLSAGLIALLFLFNSLQSTGQSHVPDDILQWESDIAVFDSLNLAETADTGTLLVTGSSSVRLWDSIHVDLAPYRVMQRGYGGARLSDFDYYANRIIKPQQFKAIVIFVANDISGSEDDRTPHQVFRMFRSLVKMIRSRNPNTPVCWIEITPTPSRWNVYPEVREADRQIASYCARNSDLHYISTFDHYITPEGLPDSTLFRDDMLHLNREGYKRWAGIIKSSLREAGIDP